jgi:hypothetical protein
MHAQMRNREPFVLRQHEGTRGPGWEQVEHGAVYRPETADRERWHVDWPLINKFRPTLDPFPYRTGRGLIVTGRWPMLHAVRSACSVRWETSSQPVSAKLQDANSTAKLAPTSPLSLLTGGRPHIGLAPASWRSVAGLIDGACDVESDPVNEAQQIAQT